MGKAPEWVNAIIATLLFLGSAAGLYIGLSNKIAVVSTQVEGNFKQYDSKFVEMESYQSYLQQQVDKNRDDNTRLKTQMEYSERTQEKLATSFDALATELRKTNNFLIQLSVEQKALKEKRGAG
jgi:hypothetical protein